MGSLGSVGIFRSILIEHKYNKSFEFSKPWHETRKCVLLSLDHLV